MMPNIDVAILFFINKTLANSFPDLIMPLTHLIPYTFWGLLTAFFFFRRKDRMLALLMIVAIVADFMIVTVVKDLVARERPYQVLDVRQLVPEDDNRSFPSNHVQLSFLLSTIIFRFYRRFGIILFIISALIGFGRIYLGVHYPSDVIGGALIGVLIAVLILKVSTRYNRKIFRKKI
ncbi:MAG: phosphatase PAP2 family protein [Candidatus Aenigmarchaeota archaeon]|nr:phosphatase PAP2 family protein [Candidatus Aenigmarchaeota archaeon]